MTAIARIFVPNYYCTFACLANITQQFFPRLEICCNRPRITHRYLDTKVCHILRANVVPPSRLQQSQSFYYLRWRSLRNIPVTAEHRLSDYNSSAQTIKVTTIRRVESAESFVYNREVIVGTKTGRRHVLQQSMLDRKHISDMKSRNRKHNSDMKETIQRRRVFKNVGEKACFDCANTINLSTREWKVAI